MSLIISDNNLYGKKTNTDLTCGKIMSKKNGKKIVKFR